MVIWTRRRSAKGVTWVRDPEAAEFAPDLETEHVDGVPWHDAPVPPRLHRCQPQTRAWHQFRRVFRCSCGAITLDDTRYWMERNSSRPERRSP